MIEAPKPRLKELQRQVLSRILESVPPHASVHGFLKGVFDQDFHRSPRGAADYLTDGFAGFFSFLFRRKNSELLPHDGLARTGCRSARGTCTNATPRDAWRDLGVDLDRIHLRETQDLYARPHLPRVHLHLLVGQPPYVSGGLPSGQPGAIGWCGVHAICRRSRVFHRRDIIRAASRTILNPRCRDSDGRSFSVHHRKTCIMRRGVRPYRAGLVVNRHLNLVRTDFDRLKATLTNCVRLGPESQNREGIRDFAFTLWDEWGLWK